MHYLLPRRPIIVQLVHTGLSVLVILTLLSIAASGIARASSTYGNCTHFHRVIAGQTLTQIASHFGLSVDELARANYLNDADYIYEHQQLCIPDHYAGNYEENGKNGYGYDNGYGFDKRDNHDPDMYGSVEWSNGEANGKKDFDKKGFGKDGFDENGFDKNGFDKRDNRDPDMYGSVEWSNGEENGKKGFDRNSFDKNGFDNRYNRGGQWSDD